MNLYLSDGKDKMWRKKGTANDPKHTASSVKHGGGGVMAWAYMAVSGTGPLYFTDDLIDDLAIFGETEFHYISIYIYIFFSWQVLLVWRPNNLN